MTSVPDQELAETEQLLRRRLTQLADHAPTAVRLPGEIAVVAPSRPNNAHRNRRFGAIAAVAALIGAGGFTTYSFLGAANEGGAATPEEAVTSFVSAIEHEDLLGMIDVTLPSEVGVLRGAVDSITGDATRTGLLAGEFDARSIHGVDISVNDLALDTNFLEGGLAAVSATGGTISTSIDPQAFPFGEKVRAILGASTQVNTSSTNLGAKDPPAVLMTVERDGRWYVSVEYTVAEYVRRAAGWEIPAPVTRTPVGFGSPEEAATAFYDRLASLDLQSALDTFAPGEDAMAWLAQSWIADAQSAIEHARGNGLTVKISGLTYETIGQGDNLTLKPTTFKVEGTVPAGFNADTSGIADPSLPTVVTAFDGSGYALVPPGQVPATIEGLSFSDTFPGVGDGRYNFTSADTDGTITPLVFPSEPTGGPQPFTIEHADGCTTFTGAAESMFGLATSPVAKTVDGGHQLCGGSDVLGGLVLFVLPGGPTDLPPVSVVQSGGRWYVSPLGTALASTATALHDVKDGSSLFDSPLAPFIYGGLSRGTLEVDGQGAGCRHGRPAVPSGAHGRQRCGLGRRGRSSARRCSGVWQLGLVRRRLGVGVGFGERLRRRGTDAGTTAGRGRSADRRQFVCHYDRSLRRIHRSVGRHVGNGRRVAKISAGGIGRRRSCRRRGLGVGRPSVGRSGDVDPQRRSRRALLRRARRHPAGVGVATGDPVAVAG